MYQAQMIQLTLARHLLKKKIVYNMTPGLKKSFLPKCLTS
jgi:hypothetical protein